MEELLKNHMFATHAIAAGGSVVLSSALTHPLDTLKTLVQVSLFFFLLFISIYWDEIFKIQKAKLIDFITTTTKIFDPLLFLISQSHFRVMNLERHTLGKSEGKSDIDREKQAGEALFGSIIWALEKI